ncbi:MAG: DUF2182 domain-containing protein [Candidatus Nitrotoga sp.]
MTENVRVRRQIALTVVGVSFLAWMLVLTGHHSHSHAQATADSLHTLVAMNLSSETLLAWFIMLVAMMAPTLISPLQHLWERSFRRRRARAMGLFALGYVSVWMAAGAVIQLVKSALSVLLTASPLPALMVFMAAIIWQCSPVKQRCLNRNHEHSELRAFGWAADVDTLRFGMRHGLWCIGSCWALMTLPMLLAQGHFASMGLATFLMLSESLDRPGPPRWRLRGLGKLFSILKERGRTILCGQLVTSS